MYLAQVRWLNRRRAAAHPCVDRHGLNVGGPDLITAARRWLGTHKAIGVLLRVPSPPEAAQVRATLRRDVRREVR